MALRWLCVALMVTCRVLVAQGKPDVSGHWVLDSSAVPPPNVARQLVVRQWVEWSPLSPHTGQSFPSDHITIEQRFAGDEVHTNRYQIWR